MTAFFKRIFFWLSGAGSQTLEQCPNWEQRKYVAFGATVLVPCVFGFIACAFAVSTLTNDPTIIYPVAVIWAFIIMTIDRALLSSYRPYLSWNRKLAQFGLRFVVAAFLGITIAHPMTLMLFRDTVTAEIERERQAEMEMVREQGIVAQEELAKRIEGVERGLTEQREKLAATYEISFLGRPEEDATERAAARFSAGQEAVDALQKRIDEAREPLEAQAAALTEEIETLTPQLTEVQRELAFWQKEYEREIDGQRSGLVGVGPRARSIESDQIAWRRAETARLSNELEHLVDERQRLQREATAAEAVLVAEFEALQEAEKMRVQEEVEEHRQMRRQIERQQAAGFVDQQDTVRAGINQQIELRTRELARLQEEQGLLAAEQRAHIEELRSEPRQDILTQSLALHGLFERGEDQGRFALSAYLLLIGLFMLVDTIPLVIKFFCKPGPYDTLVDRDEVRYDEDHQAFLTNYQRYIQKATADGLASLTRHGPLENSLITGVERSRAAKTFIETLVELEQTFQERMQQEREALATERDQATVERRLAMLEEMAANFQTDLRARMQEFFENSTPRRDVRV